MHNKQAALIPKNNHLTEQVNIFAEPIGARYPNFLTE